MNQYEQVGQNRFIQREPRQFILWYNREVAGIKILGGLCVVMVSSWWRHTTQYSQNIGWSADHLDHPPATFLWYTLMTLSTSRYFAAKARSGREATQEDAHWGKGVAVHCLHQNICRQARNVVSNEKRPHCGAWWAHMTQYEEDEEDVDLNNIVCDGHWWHYQQVHILSWNFWQRITLAWNKVEHTVNELFSTVTLAERPQEIAVPWSNIWSLLLGKGYLLQNYCSQARDSCTTYEENSMWKEIK